MIVFVFVFVFFCVCISLVYATAKQDVCNVDRSYWNYANLAGIFVIYQLRLVDAGPAFRDEINRAEHTLFSLHLKQCANCVPDKLSLKRRRCE